MRAHRWFQTRQGLVVRVVTGAAVALIANLLAVLPQRVSTATAAMVYVLAVTAAATLGGLVAGLTASVLSFLGLNFFFTRPYHTFVVTKPDDLIALVVFLLVSATIGTLISAALTQRARAESREREAGEARQEAETSRARAALFSSVTHDLRTPLASITASVTGLLVNEESYSPEDRRELLRTIHQEADRLNRVVGNLMDLSRMRAGALVPSRAPAGIDEVVASVVERLDRVLGDHELTVRVPDALPDVPIDVVQIDQVLTNLLENAARFGPPGGPIGVDVVQHDGVVQVRVSDRGPGVSTDVRENVFEPFVRGRASNGTGLGLAISKAIIEAHDGKIWFEEPAGEGASIVFELPVT